MRKKYSSVCKKSFYKLDSKGNYYPFKKNIKYECEELELDYFCVLINCHYHKGTYCRIFESEFKEYFYTVKELRKIKLQKIYEV